MTKELNMNLKNCLTGCARLRHEAKWQKVFHCVSGVTTPGMHQMPVLLFLGPLGQHGAS